MPFSCPLPSALRPPASCSCRLPPVLRWAKPAAILSRLDERLNHLGGDEVAVKLIELPEPEVEAVQIGQHPADRKSDWSDDKGRRN
jgi:hypothetical protein